MEGEVALRRGDGRRDGEREGGSGRTVWRSKEGGGEKVLLFPDTPFPLFIPFSLLIFYYLLILFITLQSYSHRSPFKSLSYLVDIPYRLTLNNLFDFSGCFK